MSLNEKWREADGVKGASRYDPERDSSASELEPSDDEITNYLLPGTELSSENCAQPGKRGSLESGCDVTGVSALTMKIMRDPGSSESITTIASSTGHVFTLTQSVREAEKKPLKEQLLEKKSHCQFPREKRDDDLSQTLPADKLLVVELDAQRTKADGKPSSEDRSLGLRERFSQKRGENGGLVRTGAQNITRQTATVQGNFPGSIEAELEGAANLRQLPHSDSIRQRNTISKETNIAEADWVQNSLHVSTEDASADQPRRLALGARVSKGKESNIYGTMSLREQLHQHQERNAIGSREATAVVAVNTTGHLHEPSKRRLQGDTKIPTVGQLEADGGNEHYLLEKLRNVSMEDVINKTWNEFSSLCENYHRQPAPVLPAAHDASSCNLSIIYNNLRHFVLDMESKFQEVICFPPEELSAETEKSRRKLPSPKGHEAVFAEKIDQFAKEYQTRNDSIAEIEKAGALGLINICREAYGENSLNLLGNRYLDDTSLEALHRQSYEPIEREFVEACDFKRKYWQDEYKKMLVNAVCDEKRRLVKLNEDNRAKLDSAIQAVIEECLRKYTKNMDDSIREGMNSVTKFNQLEGQAVEKIKSFFDQEIQKLSGYHTAMLIQAKLRLDDAVASASNQRRKELIRENQSKPKPQLKPGTAIRSCTLPRNPYGMDFNGVQGFSFDVLKDFMVLYLGLDTFRVGYYPNGISAGSVTQVSYEKECNIQTYLKSRGLTINASSQLKPSEETFVGTFLTKTKKQPFAHNGAHKLYAFEDIVKILVGSLKKEVEEKTQRECLSRCVICLPQSLTHEQRSFIETGARNAGFLSTYLISDTFAIAFNFLSRNMPPLPCNIITANFSEVSLDVAWITAGEESMHCTAVSGNFCFNKPGYNFFSWFPFFGTSSYSKLETAINDILKREKQGAKKGDAKGKLIFCRVSNDCVKIVEKSFPILAKEMKVCEKDYAIQGAAQLAKLINCIVGNGNLLAEQDLERLKRLNESLLSHYIRDQNK